MTYTQKERLRMLDCLLANYGHIGRQLIIDWFGVSPACATRDLALYQELAPANVYFCNETKQYHRAACFAPLVNVGEIREAARGIIKNPTPGANVPRSRRDAAPGEACDHPGCLSHISHPCEGCGRTAGSGYYFAQQNLSTPWKAKNLSVGTFYQSACSGLWYETPGAAGTISCVRVNGASEAAPQCKCGAAMDLYGNNWQCGAENCQSLTPCKILNVSP